MREVAFLNLIVISIAEVVLKGVPSTLSRAEHYPASFKRFLMRCTGTAPA